MQLLPPTGYLHFSPIGRDTALQRVAGETGRMVSPTELLQALQERGYGWLKSPRGLAGLLAPLGLVARHARESGRRGRFYLLDPRWVLTDLAARYDPAARRGHGAPAYGENPLTSVDKRDDAINDGYLRGFQEVLTG